MAIDSSVLSMVQTYSRDRGNRIYGHRQGYRKTTEVQRVQSCRSGVQEKQRTAYSRQAVQERRNRTTLEPLDDPDEVTELKIDRRTLPKGSQYHEVGHESRRVIDIDIARFVTEYRAQILEDTQGNQFVASFPAGVKRPVQ